MKKILKILGFSLLMIFALSTFAFVRFFNRAPERIVPEGNVIVSPANGDVIHIEKSDSNDISFFKKDTYNALRISNMEGPYTIVVIEMDPSDVHVQRAPITGEIVYQEHFDGAHKNALSSENVEQLANVNEKNLIVIQNEDIAVGVIQVAGMAARRIQSFVDVGAYVGKGDVYGRIILGSQVVLVIPDDSELGIEVGDVLVDGETVVATYK